jgi:hypothetical protein
VFDSVANGPAPPQPAEDTLAVLVRECDTVATQFAFVPALKAALERRETLKAELGAAENAGDNFVLVGTLGEQLLALAKDTARLPLSEEDYLTLAARHATAEQRLIQRCKELVTAKAYAEVKALGAKLQELQALDVTALPPAGSDCPACPGNLPCYMLQLRCQRSNVCVVC